MRKQQVAINYYTQANQLKEIRVAGDLGLANFSCCQDVLRRNQSDMHMRSKGVQRTLR